MKLDEDRFEDRFVLSDPTWKLKEVNSVACDYATYGDTEDRFFLDDDLSVCYKKSETATAAEAQEMYEQLMKMCLAIKSEKLFRALILLKVFSRLEQLAEMLQ